MKINIAKEFYYRVRKGDEINDICQSMNTSRENITFDRAKPEILPGEWIKVRVNDYMTHIVKPLDTIDKIAKRYDISTENLKKDNQLTTEKLYIGQLIKIYKR